MGANMHTGKAWLIALVTLSAMYAATAFADGQLRARVCVSSKEMRDLCGAQAVKLVFVNGATLYYIDFSLDSPSITPFMQVKGGIAPVISPDGARVAYAVSAGNLEFNTSSSAAWVCPLSANGVPVKVAEPACVPRFVKNAPVSTLIYSTCLKKTGNYSWNGCGSTLERMVENSIGPEQTVWAGGSYNGGVSWDDRYLSTAESSPGAYVLDLKNPSVGPDTLHKFLVTNNLTGKDTLITVQVCNLSSSPSRFFPRAVMYLDWSSSAFTNANCATPPGLGVWGSHARIFIASAPNAILRYYDVPGSGIPLSDSKGIGEADENEWDYSEWSNHPYLAASTVQVRRSWWNSTGEETYNNERIYCVNLKDSTYHKIIETTDTSKTSKTNMLWPWLWIEIPADFREDSTWLSAKTAVTRSLSMKSLHGVVRFDGAIVKSEEPLDEASVYSPRGEKILSVHLNGVHEFRMKLELQKKIRGGIYLLRVKTMEGTFAGFRFLAGLTAMNKKR